MMPASALLLASALHHRQKKEIGIFQERLPCRNAYLGHFRSNPADFLSGR